MLGEIQRLKAMGFRKKAVARALGISRNTLKKCWEDPEAGTAPENASGGSPELYRAPWSNGVDWEKVGEAVNRGQALSHYWELFQEGLPVEAPLRLVPYVSFWREYKRRFPQVPLEFHRTHPPGACCEADYKGSRPGLGYWDPVQGSFVVCELFGAVLGFSQYLSVDVTLTQQKGDFLGSMDRAYRDFGGIPRITVTDNLKTAVDRADRYDPDVNPDFTGFCRHYGTVAVPARPRKPKDKNLIEGALGLFWRWIRADLSRQRFSSLSELRAFVREWADRFNGRVQRRYGQSRRNRLEEEQAALGLLPEEPYEVCLWKKAKLHADCHVQVEKNFYSAPFTLRGQVLEVRITTRAIELFYRQDRVAVHVRQSLNQRGRYTTDGLHLPPSQKALLEYLPQRLREEAQRIGPETVALVERLFTLGNHPLRYLRRVQGLLRFARAVPTDRLEQAIRTCVRFGELLPSCRTLEGLIASPVTSLPPVLPVVRKPNPYLRGPSSEGVPRT